MIWTEKEIHCASYSNLYFERCPKDLEIVQNYEKSSGVYVGCLQLSQYLNGRLHS